ncbi:hypothetical protein H5410_058136 [Solanum commersonii]|uniref:Uncharacterized protein n=1 Tax=Solanum commersonii TaxID=4109 RepID=A0A9J5WQV3_SOLCO|nr:hypothetical protein H5410_058136 [Solanum commersonii]
MGSVNTYLDMEAQNLEKGKKKRDIVFVREYYCYKFQMRDDETLHYGRLFQQFSVYVFIKFETQRLDFFFLNPDLFRTEVLQGFIDVLRLGERNASNIGKQTFIPIQQDHVCVNKVTANSSIQKVLLIKHQKEKNSYPIYRRRQKGDVVKVRTQYLDNSWVVPYNPFLLSKFNCHINVEICSDIRAVKYI